jgi:nitrogen fixation NifU-like protein
LEGDSIDKHPCINYATLQEKLAIPKIRYSVALQVEDAYKELVLLMKKKLYNRHGGRSAGSPE